MFRATNSPILRSIFWLYIQLLVPCTDTAAARRTGRQQCRCMVPKAVYSQKMLLRMGEFVARNTLGWFKNIIRRKSCCILLVVYIVTQQIICSNSLRVKNANSILLTSRYWHSFLPFRIISLSKVIRGRRKIHNEELHDLSTSSFFFYHGSTDQVGQGLLIIEASLSNSIRHTTMGRAPLDEWLARRRHSTWQHTTFTKDIHPCPRRDSKP